MSLQATKRRSSTPVHGRWREVLRRADRRLARHQRGVWLAVLVLLAAVGIGFAVLVRGVWRDLGKFRRAGRRDRIAVPPLPEEPANGRPAAVNEPGAPGRREPETGPPRMDWRTDPRLRQAAAALARQGDLEGAINLLLQGSPDDAGVRAVAEAAFGSLRRNFNPALQREVTALRDYWAGLAPEVRKRLYPEPRRADLARANALFRAAPLSLQLADYDILPAALLYGLLVNLHAELARRSKCPVPVIEFVIDTELPGESLAKRLYWKRKLPRRRDPAVAHRAFAAALNEAYIWPLFQQVLREERQVYLGADDSLKAWYRGAVGTAFAEGLRLNDPGAVDAAKGLEIWSGLTLPMRRIWEERTYRKFALKETTLSPQELLTNPWLSHVEDPFDASYTALQVRRHPLWQQALARFDYAQAENKVPAILKQLHAGKYFDSVWGILETPLNFEATAFIGDFPWDVLGRGLRVAPVPPPAICAAQDGRTLNDEEKAAAQKWHKVAPGKLYTGLRRLAAMQSREKQARYRMIAQNFAVNRGQEIKKD